MTHPERSRRAMQAALSACVLLASYGAFAQPAVPPLPPVPPLAPAAQPGGTPAGRGAVEARLEAARQRLEQAAQEVAQLSLQLGGQERMRIMVEPGGPDGERRAMLGVQIDPAAGKGGARVAAVSPGGPAAAAGIKPDDLIVALGGTDLTQSDNGGRTLVERMRGVAAEKPLKLRVLRAGKALDFDVTPRPAPAMALGRGDMPMMPPMPGFPLLHESMGGIAGMELANLSPQLGQYFAADKGVLVVRAPAGSDWKLEDGDVITSIDGRVPNSSAHAARILASYQPGEKFNLRLLRQRKPLSLDVTLPPGRDALFERTLHGERR